MVKTVMASRKAKACVTSHRSQRSRAAKSIINKTAVQTKAVRNKRSRMSVRGKTASWTPPKNTNRTKLQASELPKLLSASRWY